MLLTGVDEAGLGPLAGPMMVCAVTLDYPGDKFPEPGGWWPIPQVRDSKKLSWNQKLDAFDRIMEFALAVDVRFHVARAEVSEIKSLGHDRAYLRALTRAARGAGADDSDWLIMDGLREIPGLKVRQRALPKADRDFFIVAAASVIAKVTHDEVMLELDRELPHYGFRNHKGYGTEEHLRAIYEHGVSAHHRDNAWSAAQRLPEVWGQSKRSPRR